MDDRQEDRLGMFVKCDLFLSTNTFTNPAIATEQIKLGKAINNMLDSDSTATRDLTGFTEIKTQGRKGVEDLLLKIARACVGYYTANPNPAKKRQIDFFESEIVNARDSDVIVKSRQVFVVAEPIKTLLDPFGAAEAEVDNLPVITDDYLSLLQVPRTEQGVNIAAGEDVDRYQNIAYEILGRLDGYLLIFKSTDTNLYSRWQTARGIDDSGGQSGTQNYTVTLYTLNPGQSITVFNKPADDRGVYFRNISSQEVTVCITAASGDACTGGFTLGGSMLIKDTFAALGITDAGTFVTITNSGTEIAKVRAGLKNL